MNQPARKNPLAVGAHLGWIIPLLISAAVYILTLCRTVFVGDSGEFALVFKTLGITHPPGYPLFTLVGHVFLLLFGFLRPALAANLLGALLAAASVPSLWFLLDGRKQPVIASLLTLLWTFSPVFWTETAGIEVYALNLTLIVALAALSFSEIPKKWFIIAYLSGLALAHHLSAISVTPAMAYVFLTEKHSNRWKPLPVYLLLFLLGLSIYLYLPVRASLSPLADWGHPVNLSRLYNHITGSQYQYATSSEAGNLPASFRLLLSLAVGNWSWVGVLVVIAGAVLGFLWNRRFTIFALLLVVSNAALVAFYRIPDIESYYLPGLLGGWMIMSGAVLWLWGKVGKRQLRLALAGIAGLAALILLVMNYDRLDRSKDTLAEDYGRLIMDTAGTGTIFSREDNASFATMYLRYAEGYRPQVEVFDQASRLRALVEEADRLAGRNVADYQEARDVYVKKAPGAKYLVKCHFPYSVEWYAVNSPLHSQGILYTVNSSARKTAIPILGQRSASDDYKSRQILVNLALCRAEEDLLQTPPDSARALEDFAGALGYMKDEPRGMVVNQLGISFRHFAQEDLALQAYDQALKAPRLNRKERAEINFNISNIYKDRGNRLAAAGDYSGAVQAFDRALEYDPQNAKLMYNVGVIYMQYLNNPSRGLPYLRRYLAANPGDEQVKKLIEAYRR